VVILVVVGDGYHKWWLLVYVELGGKMFIVYFLCGGEFGGVVMMMIRSLWVVLCWGFCDFLPCR